MPVETPKLRVFISWAGKQAEKIGQGFHDFLPDVVNAIQPFLSGSDIDKGTQWREVLTGNLLESTCEIVCLTPESLKSVWVAFDTGAISRAVGGPEGAKSRIWTYLLGMESRHLQLTPFAEYQATTPTETDTFTLIGSINNLSPDPVSVESLTRRFKKVFWPNFARVLTEARATSTLGGPAPTASEPELLSEVLRTVRSIQNDLGYQSGRTSLPLEVISLLLQEEALKCGRIDTKTIATVDGGLVVQVGKSLTLLSPDEVKELLNDRRKRRTFIRHLNSENEPVTPRVAAIVAEVYERGKRGEEVPDAERRLADALSDDSATRDTSDGHRPKAAGSSRRHQRRKKAVSP